MAAFKIGDRVTHTGHPDAGIIVGSDGDEHNIKFTRNNGSQYLAWAQACHLTLNETAKVWNHETRGYDVVPATEELRAACRYPLKEATAPMPVGSLVRVTAPSSIHCGRHGRVEEMSVSAADYVYVRFGTGVVFGYRQDELEIVENVAVETVAVVTEAKRIRCHVCGCSIPDGEMLVGHTEYPGAAWCADCVPIGDDDAGNMALAQRMLDAQVANGGYSGRFEFGQCLARVREHAAIAEKVERDMGLVGDLGCDFARTESERL